MGLVDYGSSGESSDEENDDKEVKTEVRPQPPPPTKNDVKEHDKVPDADVDEANVFSSLPKPKGQMMLHENMDKLKSMLMNPLKSDVSNKKEHVKIMAPSLNDFDNDDNYKPASKKIKPSTKGVKLFSMLPPPKNITAKETNRQLIPHVLKNQVIKPKMEALLSSKSITNRPKTSGDVHVKSNAEDEDDDESSEIASNSYFGEGISHTSQKGISDENYTLSTNMENAAVYPAHVGNEERLPNCPDFYNESYETTNDPDAEQNSLQPSNETLELDDKAMQILCGGKRKRNQMPVNIIDLSGEEIMPDSKEWLLKQLTEEKKVKSHSHRKHDGPSVQSRRKHQITYLAFQAKAQELELQNQWSNNRMSRRQTQSKYGF